MQITNVEIKTAGNGNQYKTAHLSEPVGQKDRFNIFSNHTRYNDVAEGLELDATELKVNDKGYLDLVDPDGGIKGKSGSRSGLITQAQNRKGEMIHQAQEAKEESIKLASTIRMAVDLAIAQNSSRPRSFEEMKREIEIWRSYFYTNWNTITQDEPPFPSKVGNTDVDYPENPYEGEEPF